MIRKFATAAILDAQMGKDAGFAKSAHRAVFNYSPREGYLYVRSRAISSRCNDNFDMFPAHEIEKAYMSFIGKPVFVNHHNEDHRRARGVIIDAALHKDVNPDGSPDTWVELLHEVDAVKFPKLAKAILAKEVNRTSMGCFIGDTLIAMSDGTVKRIDEIELGDLILTHTGMIEPVTYVMERQYQGTTYTINTYGQGRPVTATEEHPFWIKRGDNDPTWIEAKDIQPGDWVLTPINHETVADGSWRLATLLGYYLAEGNLLWDRNRRGYENLPVGVEWNFHEDELEYLEDIRSSLLYFGYTPTKVYTKDGSKGVSIRCNNPQLALQLMGLGGHRCDEKQLAPQVMKWETAHQRRLLECYFNGDGCYRNGRVEVGTASEQLAHQIHAIALRTGLWMTPPVKQHSPSARHKRPKWSLQAKLSTSLNKDGSRRVQGHYVDANGSWRRVTKIASSPYEGLVYNFDVKGDDSYVAGDIAVHNCDVQFSKCSVCNNTATSPIEYCQHIPGKKGKRIFRVNASTGQREGQLIFEICSGLSFFENSLLVEQPADPTAYFLGEVESGPGLDSLKASIAKAGSRDPMFYWRENQAPIQPRQTITRTASHQPERVNPSMNVWELIRKAALTDDDSLEFEAAKKMRVSDMNDDQLAAHRALQADGKKWVEDHPPHADHVVNAYNESMHHEREQGDNWYADAHHSAVHMAERTGLSTHQTSHLLAVYSPQAHWAANMHMAAHVARTRVPLGGGGEKSGGFSTSQAQADQAGRILAGEHGSQVIGKNGHKIRDFGHLIEHGGDSDPSDPKAVIDRHASSVARGARIPDHAFDVLNLSSKKTYDESKKAYVDAAARLSEQHGRHIAPHQVQATTWLVQQRKNGEQDRALVGNTDANGQGKTEKVAAAHLKKWQAYAGEHFPGLADKAPGTGYAGGEKAGTDTKQGSRNFTQRLAYGETKAPQDVDTLRSENCTVCGNSSAFDGKQCQVCGYVAPPKAFGDPDVDIARANDLRKQILDGDEADPTENDEMGNQMGDPGELEEQQSDAESGLDTSLGMLTCSNCGTGVQPAPPATEGGEPPYPADGDACPVCKKGQLLSDSDQDGEEEDDTDADGDGTPDAEEDKDGDGVPDGEEDDSDEDDSDAKKKKKGTK